MLLRGENLGKKLPEALISLEDARARVERATICILTDGKMGDIAQCLGVAERLGLRAESRIIAPRAPFAMLAPWGPVDPKDAADKPGSPLAPPFPDLAIASGRRAAPYLRALKAASRGRTLTLFLKDPRSGAGTADLIWVPEHDRLRGANVITTLTSPHRLSPERLAEARAMPAPWGEEGPVAALLLGGNSKDFIFSPADCARLAVELEQLAASGTRLVATASRRTPPALRSSITEVLARHRGWMWDETGENPYIAMLAKADFFIVTAESVNMLGEAASTGKPVLTFHSTGASRKIDQFLAGLQVQGAVRAFQGKAEAFSYEPMDSTPLIARHFASLFLARQGME